MATRQKNSLSVLYADLNNMKWINDNWGHKCGDSVLIETTMVLKETSRQSDIISRIGGDEFAVMLKDEKYEQNERTIMKRLYENVERQNRKNDVYDLSISIGVALYDPENPITIDQLLSTADTRMYECKRQMKKTQK